MRGFNSDIEVLRASAIAITLVAHLPAIDTDLITWTAFFWLGEALIYSLQFLDF